MERKQCFGTENSQFFVSRVPELCSLNIPLNEEVIHVVSSGTEKLKISDTEKEFYIIRLNLDYSMETDYWDWFYVSKELDDVIVYGHLDKESEKYSLSAWRELLISKSLVSYLQNIGVKAGALTCEEVMICTWTVILIMW